MSCRLVLVAVVILGASDAPVSARTWSSVSGTFRVEAELVEARPDDTLLLRQPDGRLLTVAVDRLSPADQEFIRQRSAPARVKQEAKVDATPTKPQGPTARKGSRAPIPQAQQVAQKSKELRELLAADYEKARTGAAGRRALCQKLMQLARESLSARDTVSAFVLASNAAGVAADGGELPEALASLAWLEQQFEIIDGPARRLELVRRLTLDSMAPESLPATVAQLLSILEEREDAADYDGAVEVGRLAVRGAHRSGNAAQLAEAVAQGKQLKDQREIYEAVAAAIKTLGTNPQDAAAKATFGKFLCLARGKWGLGLPYLAAGSDAELAPLAKRDLAAPGAAAERAQLADQWWALGESATYGNYAEPLKRRAAWWYRQALPSLTALEKLRAEKRIASAEPTPAAVASIPAAKGRGGTKGGAADKQTGSAKEPAAAKAAGPKKSIRDIELYATDGSRLGNDLFRSVRLGAATHRNAIRIYAERRDILDVIARTGRQYGEISGLAGIDQDGSVGPAPAMIFRIIADGRTVWRSRIIQGRGNSVEFKVSIQNAQLVNLHCESAGEGFAYASWANVQLTGK